MSPRPAALTGPISIVSAYNYLGIQSDHDDGSNRSSREDFVDVENGDEQRPVSEVNEGSFVLEAGESEAFTSPPRWDPRINGRPKLIQRSKAPNNDHATISELR